MSQTAHTPTPWHIEHGKDSRDFIVAEASGATVAEPNASLYPPIDPSVRAISLDEALANAAFIVLACNAHDDLVSALVDAPEMDCWPDMNPDELRKSVEGYVQWFHGLREAALKKAGAL